MFESVFQKTVPDVGPKQPNTIMGAPEVSGIKPFANH